MDILASMLAYLVCVTGIVTGLVMSFVVFFSTPAQQSTAPEPAVAMLARPSHVNKATALPVKTIAKSDQTDKQDASGAAPANAVAPMTIAIDARQKPPLSQARLRRLAERQRAKHLAYRERSSFETRFLHYDD